MKHEGGERYRNDLSSPGRNIQGCRLKGRETERSDDKTILYAEAILQIPSIFCQRLNRVGFSRLD